MSEVKRFAILRMFGGKFDGFQTFEPADGERFAFCSDRYAETLHHLVHNEGWLCVAKVFTEGTQIAILEMPNRGKA